MWEQLNQGELERIYVLANTPGFIVRNFGQEASVRELARDHTPEELRANLASLDPAGRLSEVVLAYALLVALGLKGIRLAKEELEALKNTGIYWAAEIDQLAGGVPTSKTIVEVVPRPRILPLESRGRRTGTGTTNFPLDLSRLS